MHVVLTLTCPHAIVIAADVVKLLITGYEMKSTRNPVIEYRNARIRRKDF